MWRRRETQELSDDAAFFRSVILVSVALLLAFQLRSRRTLRASSKPQQKLKLPKVRQLDQAIAWRRDSAREKSK